MEKTRVTVEDYMKLPETTEKIELLDGEIIVSPSPVHKHQIAETFIVTYIMNKVGWKWINQELDLHIGEDVLKPDIYWVRDGSTKCVLKEDGYWYGAPDLVVEILSPSTAKRDRGIKYDLYEQYGVHEYWLVDAELLLIEVYMRENEKFARRGVFGLGDKFTSAALEIEIGVTEMLGQSA